MEQFERIVDVAGEHAADVATVGFDERGPIARVAADEVDPGGHPPAELLRVAGSPILYEGLMEVGVDGASRRDCQRRRSDERRLEHSIEIQIVEVALCEAGGPDGQCRWRGLIRELHPMPP